MSLLPDLFDPAEMDWGQVDDSVVVLAARDGIPEAVAEMQRRNAAL